MSSTNVHSEQNNIQIVGGYTIPTENEMEIPPKSSGKGPSILDVRQGDTMEIVAEDSVLREDGQLIAVTGAPIAKFDKKAFERIAAKYTDRKEKPAKELSIKRGTKSADKGEDR